MRYVFFTNEQALEFAYQVNSRAGVIRTYERALRDGVDVSGAAITASDRDWLNRQIGSLRAQIASIKAEWR